MYVHQENPNSVGTYKNNHSNFQMWEICSRTRLNITLSIFYPKQTLQNLKKIKIKIETECVKKRVKDSKMVLQYTDV